MVSTMATEIAFDHLCFALGCAHEGQSTDQGRIQFFLFLKVKGKTMEKSGTGFLYCLLVPINRERAGRSRVTWLTANRVPRPRPSERAGECVVTNTVGERM